SMHEGRTPFHFLTALADLKREFPELVEGISVFFVGPTDRSNKEIINQMVSDFDLGDTVHCIDFVTHSQAVRYMKSFDVLLFLPVRSRTGAGSSRGSISGKLYEYLATGKPILALTEDGPVRDIISRSGCDIRVDHDDLGQIKKEILDCYNKFREGRLRVKPNWNFIRRFERRELTGRLAAMFDELSA
ncbi:MAG: glycosyltransferase, partial [Candidatus Zixiibacteriota bacterium]